MMKVANQAGTINHHKEIRVSGLVEGAEAHRTMEVDGKIEGVVARVVMVVHGKIGGAVAHALIVVDGKAEGDVAHRMKVGIIVVTGTEHSRFELTELDFGQTHELEDRSACQPLNYVSPTVFGSFFPQQHSLC
jgi:hypothetical protein